MSLSDLPNDILLEIFSYFLPRDLVCFQLLNRYWRNYFDDEGLWKALYKRRWDDEFISVGLYPQADKCLENINKLLNNEISNSHWKNAYHCRVRNVWSLFLNEFPQKPTHMVQLIKREGICSRVLMFPEGPERYLFNSIPSVVVSFLRSPYFESESISTNQYRPFKKALGEYLARDPQEAYGFFTQLLQSLLIRTDTTTTTTTTTTTSTSAGGVKENKVEFISSTTSTKKTTYTTSFPFINSVYNPWIDPLRLDKALRLLFKTIVNPGSSQDFSRLIENFSVSISRLMPIINETIAYQISYALVMLNTEVSLSIREDLNRNIISEDKFIRNLSYISDSYIEHRRSLLNSNKNIWAVELTISKDPKEEPTDEEIKLELEYYIRAIYRSIVNEPLVTVGDNPNETITPKRKPWMAFWEFLQGK